MSKDDERSEEELALIRKRLQQAARWSEGGPVPVDPAAPPPEAEAVPDAAKPKKRANRRTKKAAETTGAQPVETTGVQPVETAGAQPAETTGAKSVETAGAQPAETTGAASDGKPSAEPEKTTKPVRRRRTAKGDKAMAVEEKSVTTEAVPEAAKPAETTKDVTEAPAETPEPSAKAVEDSTEAAETAEAAENAEPSETVKTEKGESGAEGPSAEPSDSTEPSDKAEPSGDAETGEEAVAAFAPASEEAFEEILEEEREETERQEEADREAPRKYHGFLGKLADRKLPRWLGKFVGWLQTLELPEKVDLPPWFGPINKLNLPNQLTLLRIVLIPLMMGILYWGFPGARYVALLVFIAASITDMLDGRIARKYNLVSDFGKFADPLADKMLVTAAMLWFVSTGQMPAWALLIVVCREFAVSGLRMLASGNGRVIAAGWSGKVKTAATMVCLVLMFFPIPAVLNTICVWVITITTLYSGVEYFLLNKDVIASI